jgi:O-antigen ligase
VVASLGGCGFLLPILAGGNDFGPLEPGDGISLFGLVAILVANTLWRDAPHRVKQGALANFPNICLLVLVLWWAGTLVLRPSGPRAVLEARGMFCAILLYACLANVRLSIDALWSFIAGALSGTLVTALYGQYQYWIAFPRTAPLLGRAGIPFVTFVNANFYNANCYAAFLSTTIVLAAGLLTNRQTSMSRSYTVAGIAGLVWALLLTKSRSTMALLLAVVAVWTATWTVFSWQRLRRVVGAFVSILVVLAVAGAAAPASIMSRVEDFWAVGFLGRVAIWRGSAAMIADHWLRGVGLGRFWDYFPQYQTTSYYTRYPHSFLLEAFAELGIVGALALVGFLLSAARVPTGHWIATPSRAPAERGAPVLPLPLPWACLLLVVHGLMDIDWHAPANPILLFMLLGFAEQLPSWTERR